MKITLLEMFGDDEIPASAIRGQGRKEPPTTNDHIKARALEDISAAGKILSMMIKQEQEEGESQEADLLKQAKDRLVRAFDSIKRL